MCDRFSKDFFTRWTPMGRLLATNRYFPCGSVLFKAAELNGKVTPLGRWITLSWEPNIKVVKMKAGPEGEGYYAVAITPLYAGREISVAYT